MFLAAETRPIILFLRISDERRIENITFRIGSQKIQFFKFNGIHIAQQESLSCLDKNLDHSC